MAIYCAIITPLIRELAKELGFSDAYVNNMVSVWLTAYRRNVIPTAKDLRDYFYDPGYQDRLKSAYFVVPRYRTVEHNPSALRMTTIDWNGNFVVMLKLPHGNPLGYFFDLFKDHPELQDVIRSTKEAYQFLLWRELWHIMYGDGGHARPEEAFNFAYKKAKKFKDSHDVRVIPENTNDNPKSSNAPVVQPQLTLKVVEPLPITKIISGGLTGIDTLGLQIASEFGIETGGSAPLGFEREKGLDEFNEENLKQWGLTEVDKREEIEYLNKVGKSRKSPGAQYVYRTYKNVNDSDGTVFFRAKSSGEDRGLTATLNAARALGKPFIIDPTAEELRDWVNKHGIKVLNVAGSRGSHLVGTKGKEIANNVLRAALAGNNKNAPRPLVVETTLLEQLNSPEEYKVEYKKNNLTYTVRQDNEGYHIINKKGEEVYTNEDDGNRRMILAKLELQKDGVVVTYNNNKFIVTSDNRILSGVDGNEVYKENSEKQRLEIFKLADEKKNTSIQNTIPSQLSSLFSLSAKVGDKIITISLTGYRKGDPQRNPNFAYVFTENAEAYGYSNGIDVSHGRENEFPFKGTPKINVSDVNGTNLAGIRTDSSGNVSRNAFGIIVKKYLHNSLGRFVAQEGTFKDTDSDFELFSSLNQDMFYRLEQSGLKLIIFPSLMGLGKAALPRRFAEWLANELKNRFNIVSEIKLNTRAGYEGYGLDIKGIANDINNSEDPEDLEKLDYEIRSRAYQQAVERNKQLQQQLASIGKPAPAGITPDLRGEMKFSFGNDKRPEVVSTTTIEAIKRGERTATTRWNYLDKWKNVKIGDIILFYDENTNQAVYVKVTKPAHQLSVDTNPEEWSKKEGWSTDYYEHYVEPRVKRGEAWLFEYEYIGDTDMPLINKPKYVYEGSGELSPEEEAKLAAMGANKVQYITAALANDPDYVPKIDVSQVVHFNPDNPRIKLIRDFTAQLLADRTLQMARDFSDRLDSVIDDMLEERTEKITSNMNRLREITGNDKGISFSSSLSPELVTEVNSLRKEIDELNSEVNILEDATLGRRWALQKYTIERIIDDLKQQYQEWAEMSEADYEEAYSKDRGAYMKDAYEKIVDNFDGIWLDATIIIEGNENFRVISREVVRNNGPLLGEEVKLSGDVTDNVNTEDDNNAQFEDDEDGKRATGNDGWSYQIRFVDPLTSLSKDVRRILGNIIKKRPTGTRKVKDKDTGEEREETVWTPETDDLGNFRYINPEAAHAIILSELSDMIDADDFVVKNSNGDIVSLPALERLVDKYPWINQVIQQLKQDDRLCSKFYHDFRKDFIPCWMLVYGEVKDDYGNGTGVFKWQLMQMNKETALDSTMTQITRNYEQGNVLSEHSIYTASKEISKAGSRWVVDECNDLMSDLADLDPDEYDEISDRIAEVLKAIGLNTNKHIVSNLLQSTDGLQLIRQVVDSARSIGQEIQNAPKGSHPIDYFKQEGYYTKIAELMGIVSELDHVQSFRLGDKTYQSYSAPNYIETLIKKLKSNRRALFLEQQFKLYDWFYKKSSWRETQLNNLNSLTDGNENFRFYLNNGVWRNEWLRLIEEDEDFRFGLETKEVNTILLKKGEGKKAEYRNWTPSRIRQGFVREFFSIGINPNSDKLFAWYNMPIFSDSPVAKFIKFKRFVGEDYKDLLLDHFTDVVMQELDRIKLVLDRKKGIAEANQVSMSNFDKVGDKFHFFPELNDKETFNYGGQSFLEVCAQLNKANDLIGLKALIRQAVTRIMDTNFQEFLDDFTQEDKTSTSEYLMREGAITTAEELNMALENYFWNLAFATTLIIQITTTDLAYYKDDVDFQKRYKEVYAAGNKLNTNSRYGKKTLKVVYLSDQVITSATYVDIKRSLNEAVRAGRIKSFDRDNILNKFKDINVADAQAYRSLESMRSVLDMMGAWDDKMEAAFNRFLNGLWDMEDFNLVWLTIKPFMYTQISKPAYSKEYLDAKLSRGEITQEEYQKMRTKRIKVPHQNKNSEFLLLSTYAMVANSMGKSAKLKGIERFMKDNEIDLIQFESAVKAGCQGTIDLSYNEEKLNDLYEPKKTLFENTVKDAIREELKKKRVAPEDIEKKVKSSFDKLSKFEILKRAADVLLDKGRISQEQYNEWFESIEPSEQDVYNILNSQTKDRDGNFREEVVHTLPYDDYCVQQPTPEHLFDITNNVFGSQFRNLIISDMPDDPNFRVTVNGREFTKQQIRDLYQANIVENLLDGFLKATDKFQNIRTLLAFLLDLVRGNPKYGRDILDALQIVRITNPSTGYPEEVFNIPLDNPTTSLKIQELITSVFKNNVTKLTIRGGACILVSDFGLTKELLVLHDEKTGAITGIECYLPAYSKKFYQPFMVEKKGENGETYMELDIEKMPDEMKKLVGYRIPTEDKYSMAPLIIKGFLPQLNGSSIMLPADITQIAGSDFDVDKMFLMIPSFHTINRYDMKAAWREFYKQHPDLSKQIDLAQLEWFESYIEDEIEDNPDLADTLDINDEELKKQYLKEMGLPRWEYLLGTKKKFEQWFKLNRDGFFIKTDIIKEKYNFDKSPQQHTKQLRDNLLIDIAHAILTHPDTALKMHDPGNYDKAKLGARIDSIITDASLLKKFVRQFNISTDGDIVKNIREAIEGMADRGELDALNEFIKDNRKQRSQLTLNTFIYNHTQNMTGGALIGMYANNTTMQAKFLESEISAKVFRTFTVNGRPLNSLHDIYSQTGERISKNCANFSAASVDNVKDPVLADLLQNTGTANVTGLMLRAGMTVHEISLFFAQPAVRKMIHDMGELKADTVSNVVDNYRSLYEADGGLLPSNLDILKTHNVTTEDLMDTVLRDTLDIEPSSEEEKMKWQEEELKNLIVFANIVEMSEKLGDLTRIARADSPNGAIEPSIAKSTGLILRVLRFAMESSQRDFPLRGVGEIVQLGYLNMDMSRDEMREKLLSHPMPMLQSFFSLGIDLGFEIMSNYFSQASPFMQWLATLLMLNSDKGYLKDTALNRFFNEAITFALSKTTLFGDNDETGDTYELKREYYLYQFPKKFEKLILDNPDLKQLDIIKKLSIGQSGDIEMFNSGRLTPLMRESLMRSMDSLLFDEDNPEAQKLAVDLFMYAYYKDGFRFGPNSFGTFFSSNFISSFPEVIDILRELKYNMREGTFMGEYLPQYYANHVNEAGLPWIDPKSGRWSGKYELTEDGKLLVETKSVINPLTKGNYQPVRKDRQSHIQYIKNKLFALNGFDDFRFYEYNTIDNKRLSPYFKYITFGGILYEFQQTQDVTKVAYVPVYSSIKDNKGVRYNANQRTLDIYKELLDKLKKANNDLTTLNSAPVVNEELSEVQKALAELAIATLSRALLASTPQELAAALEETMTDVIDNIEGLPDTSSIEENPLENIEDENSMLEQAMRQVARMEEQYPISSLFLIDEIIELLLIKDPDIEQYPEEEGEKVLGQKICETQGGAVKTNTSKLEDLDLPDF